MSEETGSGGVRVGSAAHARDAGRAARSSGDGEATSKQAAAAAGVPGEEKWGSQELWR